MDELAKQLLSPLGKIEKLEAKDFGGIIVARGYCDCSEEAIAGFSSDFVEFSYRRSRAGHGAYAFKASITPPPQPVKSDN